MVHSTEKRRSGVFCLLALLLTILLVFPVLAAYPQPVDYISDESGVLSTTTKDALTEANKTLYATRGARIGVCVVDSTGDEDIASYARNLFTDWNMSDGVLLVIDRGNKNYFGVQSVDIDDIVTTEVLKDIFSNYLEEDFDAGNTDRGVMKTILKLDEFMTANLPATGTTVGSETEGGTDTAIETDKNGNPVGQTSGFVRGIGIFFKVILWIILIAALAVGGLFVAALFNDTAMQIFRTYILRKHDAPRYAVGNNYDERLYGPRPGQQGRGQNRPAQRRPQQYDEYGYDDGYGDGYDEYDRPHRNPNGNPGNRQYPTGQYPANQYPERAVSRAESQPEWTISRSVCAVSAAGTVPQRSERTGTAAEPELRPVSMRRSVYPTLSRDRHPPVITTKGVPGRLFGKRSFPGIFLYL